MSATADRETSDLTNEDLTSLRTMVGDVLDDTCTPERLGDPESAGTAVWRALTEVGVTRLGLEESGGGDGGGLLAATEVLRLVGRYAAPGPLAETMMLGGWLLQVAGLFQPSGPVSTGPAHLVVRRERGGVRVSGTVARVPTTAGTLVVAVAVGDYGHEHLVVLPTTMPAAAQGHNLARERRDDFRLDLADAEEHLHPVPAGTAHELRLRGALTRALLSAGALRQVQQRSLAYAGERVQFGRPLTAFQAVQQQLARLVAEVTAADAVVDQAVRTTIAHGFADERAELVVAAAKVRTAQAASTASTIAHQVHAALGMSQEHPLHHSTTRLWSWRSEWGSEADWSELIADRATSAGSSGLWPLMTGVS
jgi:acyl-CoA dehydrogenase